MLQYPPPVTMLPAWCIGGEETADPNGIDPVSTPRLSYPPNLLSLDPLWKTCSGGHFGAWDPPRTLERAQAMVTVDPKIAQSSIAAPTSSPLVLPSATPTPDPKPQQTTIQKPDGPVKSDLPNTGSDPQTEKGPGTEPTYQQQQQPKVSQNEPPSKHSAQSSIPVNDPYTARPDSDPSSPPHTGESQATQNQNGGDQGIPVQEDPSIGAIIASAMGIVHESPVASDAHSSTPTFHDTTSPQSMAHAMTLASDHAKIIVDDHWSILAAQTWTPPVVSIAGHAVTLDYLLSSTYLLEGQTIEPGGSAITISGTPISLTAGRSQMIIGSSTINLLRPEYVQPSATIRNDLLISASKSPDISASQTVPPDRPALSDFATQDPSSIDPLQLLKIGNGILAAYPSSILVAGTTIRPGDPVITLKGTPVSLAPRGLLLLGSSVIPLLSPTGRPGTQIKDPMLTSIAKSETRHSSPIVARAQGNAVTRTDTYSQSSGTSLSSNGNFVTVASGNGSSSSQTVVSLGESSMRRVSVTLLSFGAIAVALNLLSPG